MPYYNGIINRRDTPAVVSDVLVNRPLPSYEGLVFFNQTTPKDIQQVLNGAWVTMADTGAGTTGTLQSVTANGAVTTIQSNFQGGIILPGTTSQYVRGDGSLQTFPTNVSAFTNDAGYVTGSSSNTFTNKSGNISQWTNDSGYITSAAVSGVYLPLAGGTMSGAINMGAQNITNALAISGMTASLSDSITSGGSGSLYGIFATANSNTVGIGAGTFNQLGAGAIATFLRGSVPAATINNDGSITIARDFTSAFSPVQGLNLLNSHNQATANTSPYIEMSNFSSISGAYVGIRCFSLSSSGSQIFKITKTADGSIFTTLFQAGGGQIVLNNVGGFTGIQSFANNTSSRTYTYPDNTGTVALTSDIPAVAGVYLPLAGGTMSGPINMGAKNIENGGTIASVGFINETGNNVLNSTSGVTAIGNGAITTYQLNVSGTTYSDTSNGIINTNKFSVYGSFSFTATGSESSQLINAAIVGAWGFNSIGTFTPNVLSKHGALSGTSYFNGIGGVYSGIASVVFASAEFSSTCSATTVAMIRSGQPVQYGPGSAFTGTITNMVGVYIDDITGSSIQSRFTNKYAINQVGASDRVHFAGAIEIGNTVQSAIAIASTHKVTVLVGGTTYYFLASII